VSETPKESTFRKSQILALAVEAVTAIWGSTNNEIQQGNTMIWILGACFLDEPCSFRYGSQKDKCYAELAVQLYPLDSQAALQALSQIQDELTSDFVQLELSRRFHPKDSRMCQKIKNSDIRERCATLVRRPHLQRGYKEK